MDLKEFRERYQYDSDKDVLGQGGFGRVIRARDLLLDRWVALKVFSREVPQRYDLISEIRRAINLNHPNICRYYGAEVLKSTNAMGEPQDIQVGVMELIEGGTVDQFLKTNQKFRKKLLADVLRGLGYLHNHQPPIIHRDLKPSNVLVGVEDGVPVAKITDFGISKSASESGARVSVVGLGTYAYMAPEQLNPARYGVNGKIQCNLDLWSFGAMTMELLTGNPPFGAGDPEVSTGQIMESIIGGVSPQTLDSFEEPYRGVLRLCMVQDAGKRAQTADELLSLFEAAPPLPEVPHRQTVVEATRPGPQRLQTRPEVQPWVEAEEPERPREVHDVSAETESQQQEPGLTRIPRWALGVLAVLVLAASIAGWRHFADQSQTGQTQPPPPDSQQVSENQIPAQANTSTLPKRPSGKSELPNPSPGQNSKPPVNVPETVPGPRPAPTDESQPSAPKPVVPDSPRPPPAEIAKPAVQQPSTSEVENQAESLYKQKRYTEAIPLFERTCAASSGRGCGILGRIYGNGQGVAADYAKAAPLYSKGCDAGLPEYCSNLGGLYSQGFGVPKDIPRALALFSKACDGGSPDGCTGLGTMYQQGLGVPKDPTRALGLYGRGCDGGDAFGCTDLGLCYLYGQGVSKDKKEASKLFEKGCAMADPGLSCMYLGKMR
jgi:serine/threonine protein kinase